MGAGSPGITRRHFCALAAGCACGASQAPAVGGSPVDVGTFADFKKDMISETFVQHDFFVVRNKGRMFAMIATCPHRGGILLVDAQNSKRIVCSNHNAVFTAEGLPTEGPVREGLARLGISVNDKGRIIVDPNRLFPEAEWGDKASSIAVK